MKKILSLLGTITLIGTSTTSLVACNTPQYTEKELAELKEKNSKTINGKKLEGMHPQEKPFNEADNRGYFIIGKADKGIITKYKNNRYEPDKGGIIKELNNNENNYRLMIRPNAIFGAFSDNRGRQGDTDDGSYFKSVYRGNNDTPIPDLVIDNNGILKIT